MRRAACVLALLVAIVTVALLAATTAAGDKYDPGASDTEIRIGQTMPYSGPVSAYGTIGKVEAAYFKKINDAGGVNGRRITLISLDDGFSPPKTVEQTRRLLEQERVLFLFQPLGTAPNSAIWKYMNDQKVPQLFVATGATKWGDPTGHPWTMGWQPTYQTESRIYAQYILEHVSNPRIGILYLNDDSGKDYVKGLKDGLGAAAHRLIVAEQSYEITDPTVDSQIVNLKNSGANVFLDHAAPKVAVQAIKKAYAIGWEPLHLLASVAASVDVVLRPAGAEASRGVLSALFLKDPTDPQWRDDPGYKEWLAFMRAYYPEGSVKDFFNVYGYTVAQTMVQVLKQCGDDVTRANVMRQAASLKDLRLPLLLPGITINTSAKDFYPLEQMELPRFGGQ